jgi:hypothetical protein
MFQDTAGPRATIPVFLHRPHECRERQNPRPGKGYTYQRPSVCHRALCILRYVYRKVSRPVAVWSTTD